MFDWLTFAKGPALYFVLTLLVLGLLRHVLLVGWEMIAALRRAGDRRLPYGSILRETVDWLVPFRHVVHTRPLYGLASFTLHIGVLSAAVFLENHLDILKSITGVAWPAVSRLLLDILTALAIVAITYLLLYRCFAPHSRVLSRPGDYILLLLLLVIFVSGFLAGRSWNPIPYDKLMWLHVTVGMMLLAIIPFTKISHCVLFPLIRLGSEIAWHLTPAGGSDVARSLYGPAGKTI